MATNNINLLLLLSILCLCSTRDVYIQPSEGEHCPDTCYNINTFGKMAMSSSGLIVHFWREIIIINPRRMREGYGTLLLLLLLSLYSAHTYSSDDNDRSIQL